MRSIVATALAQARIAIIGMNTISASLEDIFLRLTGNAPGKKPAAKKAEAEAETEAAETETAETETEAPAAAEADTQTNAGGEDK